MLFSGMVGGDEGGDQSTMPEITRWSPNVYESMQFFGLAKLVTKLHGSLEL